MALADIGLPDGASTTDNDSTTSTYSSFDVCLTFAFLHGMEGWLLRDVTEGGRREVEEIAEPPRLAAELSSVSTPNIGSEWNLGHT